MKIKRQLEIGIYGNDNYQILDIEFDCFYSTKYEEFEISWERDEFLSIENDEIESWLFRENGQNVLLKTYNKELKMYLEY